MKTLSDAELVVQTPNGDREAFGHLAERYQQLALSIASGMVRDTDVVQELVQEALMQAYLSLKTLRYPDRFGAWFLVIVRNMCRTYLSRRKDPGLSLDVLARGEYRMDPEGFHGAPPNPYQETEDWDLYRRVLEAVHTLSEKNRTATLLFYYERFSHREIADHLGVSVTAVKSCLFRARNQLADLLAPVCPESAAPKPRSKPMVELTIADVVPLSLEGYHTVLMLDRVGGHILPMTVSNRTSILIQEGLRQARDRSSVSHRAKILVVDDYSEIRTSLRGGLSDAGYEVLEAPDGRVGLELVEQESPDLVLLDVRMPGLNGLEVCRRIKAKQTHAAIPAILILSGFDTRAQALEAGADDYVSKPWEPRDLEDRIESLIRQKDKTYPIRGAYDFATELLNSSGVALDEVRLEPLHGTRFIAVAKIRNGQKVNEVEALPESAIAHAVRAGSPIYASEAVLKAAGRPIPKDLGENPEELLQALTAFVFHQDRTVTDSFRQCIRCACEEARRLNASYVEPTHLVLGLLKAHDKPTLSLLHTLNLEPEVIKTRIENRIGSGNFQDGDHQSLSSSTQQVLETVFQKADPVDTDHLLIVLAKTCGEFSMQIQQPLAQIGRTIQTARDMQMGLMPETIPNIKGFHIAGRCIPAGKYYRRSLFKFLEHNGKLILTVADVPGGGMPDGLPVVMFDGVLESQTRISTGIEDLLHSLNILFFSTLVVSRFQNSPSTIRFTMGELDPSNRVFRLVNGCCLCSYHYRARTGEFVTLQVDACPLGSRPDMAYEVKEIRLESEDRMVFCSNGMIDQRNEHRERFGMERTSEAVRKACEAGLSAEETIDRILAEVETFRGDQEQRADMTFVAVGVD